VVGDPEALAKRPTTSRTVCAGVWSTSVTFGPKRMINGCGPMQGNVSELFRCQVGLWSRTGDRDQTVWGFRDFFLELERSSEFGDDRRPRLWLRNRAIFMVWCDNWFQCDCRKDNGWIAPEICICCFFRMASDRGGLNSARVSRYESRSPLSRCKWGMSLNRRLCDTTNSARDNGGKMIDSRRQTRFSVFAFPLPRGRFNRFFSPRIDMVFLRFIL
jgi:hypothetical protein